VSLGTKVIETSLIPNSEPAIVTETPIPIQKKADSVKILTAGMPTMSTGTECVRHRDVMCGGSPVKSLESAVAYTTESVKNAKHIPVQSRTFKGQW
jgi:hypothetical protein